MTVSIVKSTPLKVAFFDTRNFERSGYETVPELSFDFYETKLTSQTVDLCLGYRAVCCFVNDVLDRKCLKKMADLGVEFIALRCAGYNNVDLEAAKELSIRVCRVPNYSPESVAEFTLLQMLCLGRRIHRSYLRTKELNFSLDGLVGTPLASKTIGIVGLGKIGQCLAKLLSGFDCQILVYDKYVDTDQYQQNNLKFVDMQELLNQSDFVSLHIPLSKETHHFIGDKEFNMTKSGLFFINTGRGALVDSKALIRVLKSGHLAGAAIDVYEEEENYFFQDLSESGVDDDMLARLVTFPNVLLTSHQAFLTDVSLHEIAQRTIRSLQQWERGHSVETEVFR